MVLLCQRCYTFIEKPKVEVRELEGTSNQSCFICLGVWQETATEWMATSLQTAILEAAVPYGSNNRYSRQSNPSISLPGDIIHRYRLVSQGSAEAFAGQLKVHAKMMLNKCLDHLNSSSADLNILYPSCIETEEQGYLGVHVVLLPKSEVATPNIDKLFRPARTKVKRRRRQDTASQGGDPRNNLEAQLAERGIVMWTLSQALRNEEQVEIEPRAVPNAALDIHVAVWRRPFYVRGLYTKTRRDISQTPFYVTENGKRCKLGISSVEEEIVPALTRACGGISQRNNYRTDVIFGMAKFHGSGREDMNVRMLLPPPELAKSNNVTGRPFVCEVVDAFQLPTPNVLLTVVEQVNHADIGEISRNDRGYGSNPMGVDISDLRFVPAASFRTLQAETESKVKYYGCLCWCQHAMTLETLQMKLLSHFPLEIQQKTPIRVIHRRSNAIRIRHVLSCQVEYVDDHHFRLHISTDAGTYVKEFVHGDLGRTVPNVGALLGCRVNIQELDCEGIELS